MSNKPISFRTMRIAAIGLFVVCFLLVTSPSELPAVLLVVPFVGIFSFIYLSVLEVARLLGPDEDENGAIVRLKRPKLLSAVVAGFPVLLLVLHSLVDLTLWDVLIAFLILALGYIYVSRGSVTFRK